MLKTYLFIFIPRLDLVWKERTNQRYTYYYYYYINRKKPAKCHEEKSSKLSPSRHKMEFLNRHFLSSFFDINSSLLYKMLFMNRLEFSFFTDFFVRILKNQSRVWFPLNSASRRDCEYCSMEQKTRVCCKTDVHEFHLWQAKGKSAEGF